MTRGLVAGRFLPLHAGHQLLIETALAQVDELVLLVWTSPADPIDAARRMDWLRDLFPQACVTDRPEHVGLEPIDDAVGTGIVAIDRLFSADREDAALAERIGAALVLIDPERATIPVAGKAIRSDPPAHWHHLPPPVRAHYARTICLHGPESTGKSTLAPRLADRFGTIFVPEYGRTYCQQHGLDLAMADLLAIGRTHAAMIAAARRRSGPRLILDTDPLMTAAWADMLFGRRDPWFDEQVEPADLYLLLDIDLPWIDDGTRFFGGAAERQRFFDLSRAELERRGLPYVVIGGSPESRLAQAIAAIDGL